MTWLIADDEADILNLVAMMCRLWGHTPLTFNSGDKVWEWLDKVESGEFKDTLPELALMDIRMPGKKGNELAHRIRQVPALQHIPVPLHLPDPVRPPHPCPPVAGGLMMRDVRGGVDRLWCGNRLADGK